KATRLTALVAAVILAAATAGSVQAEKFQPTFASPPTVERSAPIAPRNIMLFFDEDSAALTDEAKIIVHDAVRAAERDGSFRIALTAFSARNELKRDPQLTARRAAAVRREIEDFGFEGDVVATGGPEPKLLSLRLGDDTLDRRVVIRVEG